MTSENGGMTIDYFAVDNGAGWRLSLRRTVCERPDAHATVRPRRPLLLIPGYGMNTFILGFHPRGRSVEAHLAWRGAEVWSVDLRGQGRSRVRDPREREPFGLAEMALEDAGAALDEVLRRTETGATAVDLLGVSLGNHFR